MRTENYQVTQIKKLTNNKIFFNIYASDEYIGNNEQESLSNSFLFLNSDFIIYSILRLSDNITFTIGDTVMDENNPIGEVIHLSFGQNGNAYLKTTGRPNAHTLLSRINHLRIAPPEPVIDPEEFLEALEIQINNCNQRDIRLEKTLKKRKENLQQFLIDFFNKHNEEKNTIYVNDGSIQTISKKRRSLGDIYKICRYYYPNCTLSEVIQLLYINLFDEIPNFRSSICNMINKRVWYKGNTNQESEILNSKIADEYGNLPDKYINLFEY